MFDEKFLKRFWIYVDKKEKDECWEWTGCKMHEGYGVTGYKGKSLRAHRVSWMIANGKEPSQSILHKCNNRGCVNPSHLRDGTHTENMLDMRKSGSAKGENNSFSKLTDDVVREIRSAKGTQRQIAKQFNVHQGTVHLIRAGKTWTHVK